jgi:hypothetical protein
MRFQLLLGHFSEEKYGIRVPIVDRLKHALSLAVREIVPSLSSLEPRGFLALLSPRAAEVSSSMCHWSPLVAPNCRCHRGACMSPLDPAISPFGETELGVLDSVHSAHGLLPLIDNECLGYTCICDSTLRQQYYSMHRGVRLLESYYIPPEPQTSRSGPVVRQSATTHAVAAVTIQL